jgi:hypothetical protein
MPQSNQDPRTEFERYFKQIPRAELGGLIKEYVAESNHGGWDGFSRHDITGIKKLFQDILIYHKHRGDYQDNDLATHINNVNPVP